MGFERTLGAVGIIALTAMLAGLCASNHPRPWYVKAALTGCAIVTLFALGSTVLLTVASIR